MANNSLFKNTIYGPDWYYTITGFVLESYLPGAFATRYGLGSPEPTVLNQIGYPPSFDISEIAVPSATSSLLGRDCQWTELPLPDGHRIHCGEPVITGTTIEFPEVEISCEVPSSIEGMFTYRAICIVNKPALYDNTAQMLAIIDLTPGMLDGSEELDLSPGATISYSFSML